MTTKENLTRAHSDYASANAESRRKLDAGEITFEAYDAELKANRRAYNAAKRAARRS